MCPQRDLQKGLQKSRLENTFEGIFNEEASIVNPQWRILIEDPPRSSRCAREDPNSDLNPNDIGSQTVTQNCSQSGRFRSARSHPNCKCGRWSFWIRSSQSSLKLLDYFLSTPSKSCLGKGPLLKGSVWAASNDPVEGFGWKVTNEVLQIKKYLNTIESPKFKSKPLTKRRRQRLVISFG